MNRSRVPEPRLLNAGVLLLAFLHITVLGPLHILPSALCHPDGLRSSSCPLASPGSEVQPCCLSCWHLERGGMPFGW